MNFSAIQNAIRAIPAAVRGLPRWARQIALDTLEGTVLSVIALNLPLASSVSEAKAQTFIVLTIAFKAAFSAATRNAPAMLKSARSFLGLDTE